MNLCIPDGIDNIPSGVKTGLTSLKQQLIASGPGQFLNDIYLSSGAISISIVISLIYTILFIYLLSAFAEVIGWICLVVV